MITQKLVNFLSVQLMQSFLKNKAFTQYLLFVISQFIQEKNKGYTASTMTITENTI